MMVVWVSVISAPQAPLVARKQTGNKSDGFRRYHVFGHVVADVEHLLRLEAEWSKRLRRKFVQELVRLCTSSPVGKM